MDRDLAPPQNLTVSSSFQSLTESSKSVTLCRLRMSLGVSIVSLMVVEVLCGVAEEVKKSGTALPDHA